MNYLYVFTFFIISIDFFFLYSLLYQAEFHLFFFFFYPRSIVFFYLFTDYLNTLLNQSLGLLYRYKSDATVFLYNVKMYYVVC